MQKTQANTVASPTRWEVRVVSGSLPLKMGMDCLDWANSIIVATYERDVNGKTDISEAI